MADLEERVLKMESQLHRIYGGVAVAVVLLLGFFGFANFYQIPRAAKDAVPGAVAKYLASEDPGLIERIKSAESQASTAAAGASSYAKATQKFSEQAANLMAEIQTSTGALRVESGEVVLNSNRTPKLIKPNGCEADRGTMKGSVVFKKKFVSAPTVTAGITLFDFGAGKNQRLSLTIQQVTDSGFTYHFNTWCDTQLYSARASWIAVGH